MRPLRVALAQINVTVGDLRGNCAKIAGYIARARRFGADLVAFPELAVTGYPPEDLLFKPSFVQGNLLALNRLLPLAQGITALIGFVDRVKGASLANALAVASQGRLLARYHKIMLPNYGVFDEKRYFTPGKSPLLLELTEGASRSQGSALRVGVSICEDIWVDQGPCESEALAGANVLINISASPYHAGKRHDRERLLTRRAREYGSWICYANLVGGQDELVFDGASMLVSPKGKVVYRAPQFQEGLFLVEIPWALSEGSLKKRGAPKGKALPAQRAPVSLVRIPWRPAKARKRPSRSSIPLSPEEEIFRALVLGTRDYVLKNGFTHVVLGLSGGIDSALTASIAVAALGAKRVTGVSMPSRYSSLQTQEDARKVAQRLGIAFLELPIERMFQAALESVQGVFGKRPPDVTEENIQARIRGTLLMALSNKFHWLVLATGNKSELSTGYCTLYGDMVGGFAVIKDLPKTWVYRLSGTANRFFGKKVIPESIFRRAPTAELKANQTDQDTLPPYERLDPIIRAYVEEDRPAQEIGRRIGISRGEIHRVLRRIDLNEYKRRQAPIGIKITPRAFGKDRRMPITNRFQEV